MFLVATGSTRGFCLPVPPNGKPLETLGAAGAFGKHIESKGNLENHWISKRLHRFETSMAPTRESVGGAE